MKGVVDLTGVPMISIDVMVESGPTVRVNGGKVGASDAGSLDSLTPSVILLVR